MIKKTTTKVIIRNSIIAIILLLIVLALYMNDKMIIFYKLKEFRTEQLSEEDNNISPYSEEKRVFTKDDCPYDITFTKVSAGSSHSLAIDEEGNLWAWGSNDFGQLGDGTKNDSNVPLQIMQETKFTQISAGDYHSLAIDEEGNLWGWGDNNSSQLGNESQTEFNMPQQIKSGKKFTQISAGNDYSLAIDEWGDIWAAGNNEHGKLGIGYNWEKSIFMPVESEKSFTQISAGDTHSLAIDQEGNLWAWGFNSSNQLGDQTKPYSYIPIQIAKDKKFMQVSAGLNHSVAIDEEGNLLVWGTNLQGQLGLGHEYRFEERTEPTQIMQGTKFNQISVKDTYNSAIDTQGNVWIWGESTYGIGIEEKTISFEPIKLNRAPKFIQMLTGSYHSFAIDEEGNLWAWGLNTSGELGNGQTTNSTVPIQITKRNQKYNVKLNTNGGMINSGNITEYTSGETTLLPTDVTKTNYKFKGWYDNEALTGSPVASIPATATGDKTFYAKWERNVFTVTFKDGTEREDVQTINKGENATAPNWKKPGYTLTWDVSFENVVSDLTVNAQWTANTNTPYTVEQYRQNITLDDYELLGSDTYYGTTEETVNVGVSGTEGFFVDANNTLNKLSGVVAGDGSLVLKIYYDREIYNVTLNTNEGTINGENVTRYIYGTNAQLPTDVTKEGHEFKGWYDNENLEGTPITTISSTETGDKKYYAKWEAATDTPYTVEMYEQNTQLNDYDLIETRVQKGTTGSTICIESGTDPFYNGFQLNESKSIKSGVIKADGSLVLKLYFDRRTYAVTLNTEGGIIPEGKEITSYIHGIVQTLPEPIREGYTFNGWDNRTSPIDHEENVTTVGNGVGAKVFYAKWIANTNTPYKVIHHFRNLDTEVEGYNEEEEPLTGTTGANVRAEYKTVEGFTKNEADARTIREGTVAGDGSLILHLYYTRNTYNIEYELNGGTPTSPLTNKYIYGKEMILQTNKVTKQGYEFAGWYDNETLTGTPVTSISATATGDKTFYAKWTKNIFTVTFKDGTEREDVQTINKGENATAPSWIKPGYTLTWDKTFTNVTSDLTVNAQWEARTDTPYKVIHHYRNLDTEVEGYNEEEEPLTGTTGANVRAEYKTVEGFTKNEADARTIREGTVAGDGSLVLHLYYTRNTYNIEYELNGGTTTSPLTNKYIYGNEMILQTNKLTKEGYTFAGWYDNEELTGSPITSIPSTATGNKKFYAKWVNKEQEYYILSEKYSINLQENTITKVSPKTTMEAFLNNIDTNGQKKLLNLKGEEVAKEDLVGTGYKLQVTFKGEVHTYEIAVRGDLDGNGKITTTDLSIINQQILNKIELTGIKKKAADTNYDGKLTTTDLSMINQAVLKKIVL